MFYVYVVSFGLLLYRRPIAVFVLFFVFYFLRTKEEKSKGYTVDCPELFVMGGLSDLSFMFNYKCYNRKKTELYSCIQ